MIPWVNLYPRLVLKDVGELLARYRTGLPCQRTALGYLAGVGCRVAPRHGMAQRAWQDGRQLAATMHRALRHDLTRGH